MNTKFLTFSEIIKIVSMKKKNEEVQLNGVKSDSNLISILINNHDYEICFDQLAKQSDFISQNYSKDTANSFAKAINNAKQELNIYDKNFNSFMDFLSGKTIIINQINSFDLYKLSSFFQLDQISHKVQLIWQFQHESIEDDIDQFLQLFDDSVKNDKQRTYLNDFIQYTLILDKLKSNIDNFFQRKYIDHFSPFLFIFY